MQDGAVDTDQDGRADDADASWLPPTGPAMTRVEPIDQSALTLPTATAPTASPSATPAASTPISYFDVPTAAPRSRKKQKRRGPGRALAFLVVVGGLGAAGAIYGPGLYDEYVAEPESVEPEAPMAFPTVRSSPTPVRTATFELDGLSTGTDAVYTITVDFETWVSRVVIDRPADVPDLEVLTFSDDAIVRRLDSSTWFQLDRGEFPFDGQLQRTDWIRSLDDLLPPDRRGAVEIVDATESDVGGVTTRRLVIDLDPAAVRADTTTDTPIDAIDPMGDIAGAVEVPVDSAETPVTTAAPAVVTAAPEADADGDGDGAPVRIELWVDGDGIVRRSVGAETLGEIDATILDTSTAPWLPEYPDASQVLPMTAGALLELGL